MKVAIITCGCFPVPASKGGAVEALDEYLIKKNEQFKKLDFEVLSIYDKKAIEESKKYNKSNFVFIKPPKCIEVLDILIYHIAKDILKKVKHMQYRYILQRLYFINKVSKILNKNDYDRVLIENHSTLFMALKRRKNYEKYKDKYYYHLHNEVSSDYGCRDIIKNCKKILSVSNFVNIKFSDHIGEINCSKLDVLKNCVDIDKFNKVLNMDAAENLKKKYNIHKNEKILIFVGRLNEDKGIKELLLAFRKVKYQSVKLLIVGSCFFGSGIAGNFEVQLKKISEDIRDKIIFTGFIPYTEIPAIYSMADISIVPSIWNDPAPLTIIESMAAGVPLITTYSGGIPEYANDKCAIFLERNSSLIDNLAVAIDNILTDEGLRKNMAKASRETALELNLDNYYSNFVNLIAND